MLPSHVIPTVEEWAWVVMVVEIVVVAVVIGTSKVDSDVVKADVGRVV